MSQSDLAKPPLPAADSFRRASRAVSIVTAVYGFVGGLTTLAGWAFNIRRLTDWADDGISMFPNTAAGVAFASAALMLANDLRGNRRAVVVRVLACVPAAIGGLTLVEYLAGVNLGIDTLLFDRPWGQVASTAPMRMGIPALSSFIALGGALILTTYGPRARRIASGLAMGVLAITSLSLIGYWFGANELFGIARLTAIAWQSSTMLASLGIGVMAAVPEYGLASAIGRDDVGGTALRRLIVPIIGIPLLLGWLHVVGQQADLYDAAFGTAVRTLAEIALLLSLLWWTAHNISQHSRVARKAEQALRESENRYREIAEVANNADRRKDEFLATLAHELRNPLAPIGNALLIMKHANHDEEAVQLARDTMGRQFGQMVRLVDDLLDAGRITRDKLELRTQRAELASVIHQAVETCRPLAEEYGHKLDVSVAAEPIWVNADAVRLAQVFSNLLNNACKFTEPGGRVSIDVARGNNEAIVSVRDSGIGISPENRKNIFNLFEQADKTLERTRGGLGIGLTLAKRLVELHGGRITVSSDGVGHGSEFVVHLPVVAGPDVTKAPVQAAASPVNPRRILVTDDNRDAANSMALLLRANGHAVEVAYDGTEALQKAAAWKPEVMLLDLGMPNMNGFDVCRTIRSTAWGADIKVVALTGWGQEQDRQKTREAGFDDHLVKPVEPTMLRRVLALKQEK